MPKYFVELEEINQTIEQGQILLKDEDAKHITVVRAKIGDKITICDGQGTDYTCEIAQIEKKLVVTHILDKQMASSEPAVKITLFQGIPKSDKMELIIQKCVELGVHEIVPVNTEHTIAKIMEKADTKVSRWQKISEAAAKQSGRGIIPKIHMPITFSESIDWAKKLDENYIAYENEQQQSIKDSFQKSVGTHIGIFIGPEGGFAKAEVEKCISNHIVSISLGKRILRTETAGFTALIALLYSRGDL